MKKQCFLIVVIALLTLNVQAQNKTFQRKEATFSTSYVPTQFGTGLFNIDGSWTWGGSDIQIGLIVKAKDNFNNFTVGAIGKTRLFDIGMDTRIGGMVEVDADVITTPKVDFVPISLGFGINYAYYFKGTWVTGAYGKVFVFGQRGTMPKEFGGFISKAF